MELSARIIAAIARLTAAINAVDVKASSAGGGSSFQTISKAADTSRQATTALTADPDLKIALAVGQWRLRLTAILSSANATMDYKYSTAFSGTGTVKWFRRRHSATGAVAGTDNENTFTGTGHVPSTGVTSTTTGIATVEIELVIVVTVSGEFQFNWAQNTSDPAALLLLEGSTLQYIAT